MEEEQEHTYKNEPKNPSHGREYDICMHSTLFFAGKYCSRNMMPVLIETSILELNKDGVTALAKHEPRL